MFANYNFKSIDETFDVIVNNIISSARECFEGKSMSDRQSDIYDQNVAVVKYALENTRFADKFATDGLKVMKNPMVTKNEAVRDNFDAVIAQIINAVAPSVTSADYAKYLAEVVQVGWGDTARFLIKSNDLFKVNQIAEGVNRGALQPIYNNEVTVNCTPVEIATSIDWYAVAAGVFDWGDFALRAGRSFEGYIFLQIVQAMSAITTLPTAAGGTTILGPSYVVNGFSNSNWAILTQRVSAANGGAEVYGLGTVLALSNVIPNGTTGLGLQYGLGQRMADEGYLDKYFGSKLIPVDNVLTPGTTNFTAALAVPNDVIFVVAADAYKPVKIVFEGDSMTVERVPNESTDKTYGIRIQMRIGVSAIVGSKFGAIKL